MKLIKRFEIMLLCALFTVAFLLVWQRILFFGLVPSDGNSLIHSFPGWKLLRGYLLEGRLPLWDTLRNMGEPFLADPQKLAAYPVNWLLCLLPDYFIYVEAWVMLHTAVCAVFAALAAYLLFKDRYAACLAALLFCFNGFYAARVTMLNPFAVASWFPAVIYFQLKRSYAGMGCALAMCWLAGYPPFFILICVTALLIALWQGKPGLGNLVKGYALMLGLIAFQFIPFLELVGQMTRGVFVNPETAVLYSIPPLQLLKEVLVPFWPFVNPSIIGDPAIVFFYTGITALLLSGYALIKGNSPAKLAGLLTAAALLLSLGGYLPLYKNAVLLHVFRYPANWLLIAAAGMALLGAYGLKLVEQEKFKWLILLCAVIELAAVSFHSKSGWAKQELYSEKPGLASLVKENSRIYHTGILLDKWSRSTLKYEKDYLLIRDYMLPSYGTAFGIREIDSYQVLETKTAKNFKDRLAAEGPASPLVGYAGISTVVTIDPRAQNPDSKNIKVLFIRKPAPLVFIAGKTKGAVQNVKSKPGNINIDINTKAESQLVVSETAYPGWTVQVNGSKAPLAVFESAFLSVKLPAGQSKVKFRYRPATFIAGSVVTVFTILLMLSAVFLKRLKKIG